MYKCGVLHRDVSAGNIIIQPASPDRNLPLGELVTRTRGRLIDLDHAKYTSRKVAPRVVGPSGKALFKNTNDAGKLEVAATKFYPKKADATSYCERAGETNIFGANLDGDLSPEDFGWEDVGEVPDYESHVPRVVERTGTIPFISHELMTHEESTIHNAIHDLESFWWIIIYLCLTRESGGGHRRKNEAVTDETSRLIRNLFDSSDLQVGKTKAKYFHKDNGTALFDALLTHFPGYFAPLESMLKRWREVVVLGYTFKAYEYHLVHKYVLRIIAEAINSLPVALERSEAVDNEIRRREDDYGYICRISSSTNVQTPTPIVVTSSGISPIRNRGVPPSARPTTNPPSPTPASKVQKK
ncbi:hypothetical protein Clacol_004857 [Clathrus columnatus]|uniref:Fungal-type protein kinase domain-containing protein n=1 Tax=Clathrus columnatus TaxID=1419009 RepID=A0AAV5AFA5_9AGAM|nr:hypothetical protein Clacol_004857 [Clathrus columnatus]